jgi:hypothetical protein
MNDKKINKLNDRKRKLDHEYNQGKDYFMETSMENFIEPNRLYNNSMYQAFVDTFNEQYQDESIDEKNSPRD